MYRQAFYHEPMARVIAQALPVFDVKFTFTFFPPGFIACSPAPKTVTFRPSNEGNETQII